MTSGAASEGRLRPFEEGDLPAVAALHRRVFERRPQVSEADLDGLLAELFCRNPWRREGLSSLVWEEGVEITGCLGVMPRPMSIDGEPILAAVSHNFMVAPERRSTMAGVQLLRAFLAGPQALSLAEGNEPSRRLWTAMGGTASIPHSLRWTRPLRPARYALSVLARRRPGALLAAGLKPLSGLADRAAARLAGSPLRRRQPRAEAEELDAASLAEWIGRFSRRAALRPRYDVESLDWLLRVLSHFPGRGALRKALLRRDGAVAGWYVYSLAPGGVGEVVQVGATERTAPDVLDHLFEDAWRSGAVALSGQLEPSLLPALSERLCLLHRGPSTSWLLAHSRNERILRALHFGEAFFTHLEGEWWL